MRIVPAQELENWLSEGRVLEKDGRGPKVVVLPDGLFLKIFHTRRRPWLARLQPAAQRFARNAQALQGLGITAPKVHEVFWLNKDQGLSGCLYQPLPGRSIEQIFTEQPKQCAELLKPLAGFIKQLHQKGIYFRSLHLGNILLIGEGEFGLIDILDLKQQTRPLNHWQVQRNFAHLRRYLERKPLPDFPLEQLLAYYQQS